LQVTEPVAAPQPVGRGRAVFRGIDGNRVQATQPLDIAGRDSKQGVEQLQHLSIENGNRSSQTCAQRSTQVQTQRIPAEGANQQNIWFRQRRDTGYDNQPNQQTRYQEQLQGTRPKETIDDENRPNQQRRYMYQELGARPKEWIGDENRPNQQKRYIYQEQGARPKELIDDENRPNQQRSYMYQEQGARPKELIVHDNRPNEQETGTKEAIQNEVVRGDNSDRQGSTYREEKRTRPETCIVKTGKRLINNCRKRLM